MKTTTITLKQLRADPREYVRLLNNGHEVAITDHRRELARTKASEPKEPKKGDIAEILKTIKSLPPVKTPYPEEDTVKLMKRTKLEYLERKYGYRK